jgi:hypothetical protein
MKIVLYWGEKEGGRETIKRKKQNTRYNLFLDNKLI